MTDKAFTSKSVLPCSAESIRHPQQQFLSRDERLSKGDEAFHTLQDLSSLFASLGRLERRGQKFKLLR
jgi:hypothetical protein